MKTGPIIRERIQGIPSWLWRRAAASPRLLMLDYDGTLAPFQDYPRQATPDPRARRLLYRMAASPGTTVAIISGRPVREIAALIGPLPVWLVGEHGWESRSPQGDIAFQAVPEPMKVTLGQVARQAVQLGWGPWLERKNPSIVLHTRGLPADEAREMTAAFERLWLACAWGSGLRLRRVNGGLELKAPGYDKGTAVRDMMQLAAPGTFPVYIGDDEGDEDAFRAVRDAGLGIRVGAEDRPSLARGRLKSPAAVAQFLDDWLAIFESREPCAGAAS